VEAGNRIVVSIATTDQGYATDAAPAVWRVGVQGPLRVPVVPGEAVTANTVPLVPAIGLGAVLGAALLAWLVARFRRGPRPSRPRTPLPWRSAAWPRPTAAVSPRCATCRSPSKRGQVLGPARPRTARARPPCCGC
jgi:hypothetical protein